MRTRWAVFAAALLAIGSMVEILLRAGLAGEPVSWLRAGLHGAIYWGLWLAFLPVIRWVVERAFQVGVTARGLVTVAIAGIGLVAVQTAVVVIASAFIARDVGRLLVFGQYYAYTFGLFLLRSTLAYGLIVTVLAVVMHQRWHRETLLGQAALERSLAEARLQHLQSQLRPHFLFNALHAIATMVMKGERQRASDMIGKLAGLLRISMRADRAPMSSLEDEFATLQSYLDIERMRLGERLQVRLHLARPAATARVPTLLLQPLVENAIRHGVERSPEAGRVEITAAVRDGWVAITVEDDGPGLVVGGGEAGHRIGLENTRARLRQVYGDRATLELVDGEERGAVARVVLPMEGAEGT